MDLSSERDARATFISDEPNLRETVVELNSSNWFDLARFGLCFLCHVLLVSVGFGFSSVWFRFGSSCLGLVRFGSVRFGQIPNLSQRNAVASSNFLSNKYFRCEIRLF